MRTPHKHVELIKAWADGAVIESRYKFASSIWGNWREDDLPDWHDDWEYRIKPEPKPDIVMYANGFMYDHEQELISVSLPWSMSEKEDSTLKVVFDGETGKLKDTEVLK